jgi:hypothetical protein
VIHGHGACKKKNCNFYPCIKWDDNVTRVSEQWNFSRFVSSVKNIAVSKITEKSKSMPDAKSQHRRICLYTELGYTFSCVFPFPSLRSYSRSRSGNALGTQWHLSRFSGNFNFSNSQHSSNHHVQCKQRLPQLEEMFSRAASCGNGGDLSILRLRRNGIVTRLF